MWIQQVVSICSKLRVKIIKGSPIPPISNALETPPPQNEVVLLNRKKLQSANSGDFIANKCGDDHNHEDYGRSYSLSHGSHPCHQLRYVQPLFYNFQRASIWSSPAARRRRGLTQTAFAK